MSFDFERILENKRKMRQRLAAAPIVEKLRMLDALRERAVAVRAATARQTTIVKESASDYGKKP